MKQYYESEVLFQLMERDGLNIPSSVPPYEAEIKAYLINQVKQAYPKLTDYEAEWLLYNYTKHLPAEFPISSVSDVTEATFENVVPFAYQSAILTGQTKYKIGDLVQNQFVSSYSFSTNSYLDLNDGTLINGTSSHLYSEEYYTIPSGTQSITLKGENNYKKLCFYDRDKNFISGYQLQTLEFIDLNKDVPNNAQYFRFNTSKTENVGMGLYPNEYLDVYLNDNLYLTNKDFTQELVSVKIPVLTTTGKNLVNLDKSNPDGLGSNSGNGTSAIVYDNDKQGFYTKTHRGMCENLAVKPNTYYTISADFLLRENSRYSFLWHNPTQSTGDTYNSSDFSPTEWRRRSITRLSNEYGKINWIVYGGVYFKNLQVEEGSTATTYEPHKSNILTVNEPVELRGIGDVQDELNCLTGEFVQRIGEIILDDGLTYTKTTVVPPGTDTNIYSRFYIENIPNYNSQRMFADKFRVDGYDYIGERLDYGTNGRAGIMILKSRLTTDDVNGLKAYLRSNPITIQYKLATESVKTVDLTTVNEKGETTYFMPLEGTMDVQSSGEIKPTFDMSVPVEATTQNLASFIDLETEE